MSTKSKSGAPLPPAHEVLIPVADTVDLAGVSLPLVQFALKLAYIHFLLFDTPLEVTAGAGVVACDRLGHCYGRGLDVRTSDLNGPERAVFWAVAEWMADTNGMHLERPSTDYVFKVMHIEQSTE